jgi:hypothetical protein
MSQVIIGGLEICNQDLRSRQQLQEPQDTHPMKCSQLIGGGAEKTGLNTHSQHSQVNPSEKGKRRRIKAQENKLNS